MMDNKTTPIAIKIVAFLYALISAFLLLFYANRALLQDIFPDSEITDTYVNWVIVTSIITILCSIFLWQMKRWAAFAFFGLFFVSLSFGMYHFGGISAYDLVEVVPLYFIYKNLPNMV